MPGMDGTGPQGQGPRTGRGRGRCGGQTGADVGGGYGGGRRRLRMRAGMGPAAQPAAGAASPAAMAGAVQRSGLLASGQEVAELKKQVLQLTQAVQALAQQLRTPDKTSN